jgi:hypothetical protein
MPTCKAVSHHTKQTTAWVLGGRDAVSEGLGYWATNYYRATQSLSYYSDLQKNRCPQNQGFRDLFCNIITKKASC